MRSSSQRNELIKLTQSDMKFQLLRSRDNQYYWVFVSGNNEVICVTETYRSKEAAKHSIALVMKYAGAARYEDLT